MTTTFYICRHGQTENNKNRRLMGWIDSPLTESGVSNAVSSAAKLKGIRFDKIISSDLGRAFITAYIISRYIGYTSEIERIKELREANYGELANLSYDDPRLSQLGDPNSVSPEIESLEKMQTRVIESLQTISSSNDGKTILIVGHDGTINAVRSAFKKKGIDSNEDIYNAHDVVGTFEMTDGEITSFKEHAPEIHV